LLPAKPYYFHNPLAGNFPDGYYLPLKEADVLAGVGTDTHAGATVLRGAKASETQYQFFYYKINDGVNYNKETDNAPQVKGDPYGEIKIRDTRIVWNVFSTGNNVWKLRIDKGADGFVEMTINAFPFKAS
jgi:hypothetical protein